MDNKDLSQAPNAISPENSVSTPSNPAETAKTGTVSRRSFIAGGLAAIATMFGRKAPEASAATPQQNMVAGVEAIRMEPGAQMAAAQETVQMEPGAQMAAAQETVQMEPGAQMAAAQETVQMEPGAQMAQDAERVAIKDFAGSQERVLERGNEMAHDQEDSLNNPSPSESTSIMNPNTKTSTDS
jgi:hypothetical protein